MAVVYRLSRISLDGLRELFSKVSDIEDGNLVAIKLHMGELMNYRFIRPVFVREIVEEIKEQGGIPFLTDCTTLYRRGRFTAVDYLETARKNGFNVEGIGAPIIIADGLTGENGVMNGKMEMGQAIYEADYLVSLTHCTGHISAGYGGAIKNLGMGCMTKNGKRAVHKFSAPEVDTKLCKKCGTCIEACPYSVISMREFPKIDKKWCVGCGRCIEVCPQKAMQREEGWLTLYINALVEAATSVCKKFGERKCFINFLTDITADCDCAPQQNNLIPDQGILASKDLVAIEQASYDLIKKAAGKDILEESSGISGSMQMEIAEDIRAGSRKYEIQELK